MLESSGVLCGERHEFPLQRETNGDVLRKRGVQNKSVVHTAQPYVIRDDESEAARLDHIRTTKGEPNERQEDQRGQCHPK